MNHYYLDTSALIKRYHNEDGTDVMNALMEAIISEKARGVISSFVMPETISALNRKRNAGLVAKKVFKELLTVFYEELKHLKIISVDDRRIVKSIPYILKYNLNSADALHLVCALSEKDSIDPAEQYFFICCDERLIKAATKEGVDVINPENQKIVP